MKIGKKVIYETIKLLLEKDDNLSDLLDSKNIAYLIFSNKKELGKNTRVRISIKLENEEKKKFELDKDEEIKRLKEEYMILQNASDEVEEEKDKEIERLNNIINELEKYLWEERYNHHGKYVISGGKAEDIYTLILMRLKELKGSDKE